ncbi:hypothetical protein [Corynebacterium sphenisci]|uniref:hypothetical protein n=1 Tax=Corynebacterium sphenisci TaxID=191493 RepID=UPI0026DFA876|nr:hypothetical protein [Corynebacterium sphenisci]MDO5730936.1 hypothetical protein [Corynebacterium sphenisci]
MATNDTPRAGRRAAGAIDIRNVIGLLLALYGVVLLLSAMLLDPGLNPDTGLPKEPMYNTWAGVALVVVAAAFFLWAKLRPIIVPVEPGTVEAQALPAEEEA